ncbi:ADP-ribosylation factor GTPase-activating protein AGD2-like isoform X2 [Durio zibethinus]|uniref:ADP-ribosylation factor GTPase-activating protein AGD2-like isoform X2 n=1 Tax=Durio zibethinus TaxID=66656 RepID=A0A6P5WMS5_DURZI|nr:ADP-ribosylation factor GTPase-activating protein AGD2-like isoform X2 [Durio zibethinus]
MIERQAAGLKGILEELPSREASQFRLQESHQGFDKIMNAYDQACEKLVSLEKNTQGDIVAKLEELLARTRSSRSSKHLTFWWRTYLIQTLLG